MNKCKKSQWRQKKVVTGKGDQRTTPEGRALAAAMNGRGKGYLDTISPEECNLLKT